MLVIKRGSALPIALVAAPLVLGALNQGIELIGKIINKKKKSAEDKAFEAAEKYANLKLEKEGFYNKSKNINEESNKVQRGGKLVQFR